jgi:ATP-dependent helicase/nuclease subunit A
VADLFLVTKDSGLPLDDTGESRALPSELPPDWRERQQALDIRRSWIVEAPAGSGKTGLLIQRYLKLLSDESVEQPEQVLTITFTRKATEEIRERVLEQLTSAANGEFATSGFEKDTRELAAAVLKRDQILGWNLLDHPRRLNVRTIDSVCSEIAGLLPVLSDSGRLAPVEDAGALYRQAARNTLMQVGGEDAALNAALRTLMMHRDGNIGDCERLLAEMLGLREQWGELIIPLGAREMDDAYLDGVVLPQLERSLDRIVSAGLTELQRKLGENALSELSELAIEMSSADAYGPEESPIAFLAELDGPPGVNAEDRKHWKALTELLVRANGEWRLSFNRRWLQFEIERSHQDRLRDLVDELSGRDGVLETIRRTGKLPQREYPREQWEILKALFRVLPSALAELRLVFAARGECDFAEVGLMARTALHQDGAGDLAAVLGMRLQHLLVDEMQDTSTSQYDLIELLTQGWDGHSQTVFLVGDPKQSIYLFRQARVERFVRTMMEERLGELRLGCLRLTANFRSQRELVEGFNRHFAQLFPSEPSDANPEEVQFAAASPVRGRSEAGAGMVWHASVIAGGLPKEQQREQRRRQSLKDARAVREIIQRWRKQPLPEGRDTPWKIAVLVRNRNHLINIVAALKCEEGDGPIPFRAVDIEALDERPEVLDLFALTRALLHPADRVAQLAVLHAPWCGLGLADLHRLTGADDSDLSERCLDELMDERADLLSPEGASRLERVRGVFRDAGERRSQLTLAQLVEKTWRSLGGSTYLSDEELVNVRRYLELLDEMEAKSGAIDLGQLGQRLKGLYAEPSVSPEAVDLLTIHKAKGLEWDVVIVPELARRSRTNVSRLLNWSEFDSDDDAAARVLLAPITAKGDRSKKDKEDLGAWLLGVHNAREAAERKRLFYVACTRAREELHLFGTAETKADGNLRSNHGSLLHTAWNAAQAHFEVVPSREAIALADPEPGQSQEETPIDLAASAETRPPRTVERLPSGFNPATGFDIASRLPYGQSDTASASPQFERPEGSFQARAFGNAVHAFLELLSKRLSDGASPESLLREIAGWGPRVTAVLRADGVPPSSLAKRSAQVIAALTNTLRDPEGLWVLSGHEDASSEYSLTSWTDTRHSVRLDRVFHAGPMPLSSGRDCLWIVDYKTASHGTEGLEEFLAEERAKYAPQLHAYATMLTAGAKMGNVRIGLYYPMISRLVWWTLDEQSQI